ncbi:hypothetical protein D6C90_09032 [Aureobasidium pullulans]|uniref:NTF2-like protein n=1 Tax=Aureobasidium pullulans TaxID=5580 RepID=A0A4S9GK36_AURPU|nr:hypothetical protein D6D08_08616 [Aureobasidium pullulans]THZ27086.1 hypothetical protein D6C90_09032 [Aureobasidium pullulans]
MADTYLSFLRSPSESALAHDAALHYITTTTSIHEASAIIKHFQTQDKVVKKKSEIVLSSFGTSDGAVVETDTTFEFVRGGGAILPQMDDNMLADSVASLPMVHVVQYNGEGKISQIRIYWDQSTMLRQVDAIGKSGRNWPIRDGTNQVKTIKQSINNAGSTSTSLPSRAAPMNDINGSTKSQAGGRQNGDFHARLFATGEGQEPRAQSNADPAYAVRTSAKPAPRQMDEIFANGSSNEVYKPEGKPKAGSGKNFHDNRLFDETTQPQQVLSPDSKKINPEKFNHFEFPNGKDGASASDMYRRGSTKGSTHTSNWDFQDFTTPEKHKPRPNPEQERHIGPGVDEDQISPEKRPIVHAPRPDANAHFEIADDSPAGPKAPFSNHTNVDKSRRGDEYQPHFNIGQSNGPKKIYKTAGNGMGGRAGAPTLWDEPEPPTPEKAIYKTYGNGMGGRRDGGLSWDIGDEGDSSRQPAIYKTRGDGMGGRRDKNATTENDTISGAKGYASSARAQNYHSSQRDDEYEF